MAFDALTFTLGDRPRPPVAWGRWMRVSAIVLALAASEGCNLLEGSRTPRPPQEGEKGLFAGPQVEEDPSGEVVRARIRQIDGLVQAFADRYAALVTGAADSIHRLGDDPARRLAIDRFQARTVSAVYDIATNEDAYTKVLDLVVVVTLTANFAILEGYAFDLLGEDAGLLAQPLQRGREEVDAMAATILTPQEQVELARLIREWRSANPDVENLAFIRFGNFAQSRGKSQIAEARSNSGLLAPISQAVDEAARSRLLAERAFYMAKRAPLLVSLESAAMMSQVASMPEMRQALAASEGFAKSAERLSAVAEELPGRIDASRDRIVESVEKTSGVVQSTLGEYRRAIERTDELVASMRGLSGSGKELLESLDAAAATMTKTLVAAERVATVFVGDTPDVGPPHAPFDPEVYARMLVDIRGSLVELNSALDRSRELAEGGLWEKPIAAIDAISKERVEHAAVEVRSLVDLIFVRTIILAAVVFALGVAYRFITLRMRAASAGAAAAPGAENVS
jgi:hypothetical protein